MAKGSGHIRSVTVKEDDAEYSANNSIATIISSLNATAVKASEIIKSIGKDIQKMGSRMYNHLRLEYLANNYQML